MSARAIAVFGGAFDPIHYGHLRTVAQVQAALKFAQVRFVPTARPPHRAAPLASGDDRVAMLKLALAAVPDAVIDTCEFARPGPSYMVDTLASLRAQARERPLALILGADALWGFADWHRSADILRLAHIVAMTRPAAPAGVPPWALPRLTDDAGALDEGYGRVWLQSVTAQPISSTAVRTAVATGDPPLDWLPPAVWQYILSKGLYRSQR